MESYLLHIEEKCNTSGAMTLLPRLIYMILTTNVTRWQPHGIQRSFA